MHWGYILVWMPDLLKLDNDPLMAKLKWLAQSGLESTGIDLETVEQMDEAEREQIGQFLSDHDLSLTVYTHHDYLGSSADEVQRTLERTLHLLDRYRALLRTRIVTTGVGRYHRFMREPSLDEQMERLAPLLTPLARGCHELGLPFGIENHGDYYCSDLVTLCQQVPHLGIFLDTGNTYLIGEAPLPAFRAAAPYVIGGHFKDQRVQPQPHASPLHFEVGPATLGEGDVPLRECYQLLREHAPNPDNLVMEIELIPVAGVPFVEAFDRSLAFIRSLGELRA